MRLIPLPAFSDNYIWLLHNGRHALVVDPGQPEPVLQALQVHGLTLSAILVTHHHGDHTGGVVRLREQTAARVFAPALEDCVPHATPVCEGQTVSIDELSIAFAVLDVPGHTRGHVAYHATLTTPLAAQGDGPDRHTALPTDAGHRGLLFCGDTLFSAGCGRLFEGTAAQLYASLQKLARLADDTLVCCAHEYTLSNLRFARAVEPHNPDVIAYQRACELRRHEGLPTLPSTIGLERRINPFLRTDETAVVERSRQRNPAVRDPVSCLATLREWKNGF